MVVTFQLGYSWRSAGIHTLGDNGRLLTWLSVSC